MRRIALFVVVSFFTFFTFGQTLKIQTGPSFSSLDFRVDGISTRPYNETLIGYSIFMGVDYLDKKYFNLSSNLGLLRKGGKQTILLISYFGDPGTERIDNARLDYLSLNTLIDLKYPITDKITPYLCFGPRIDYLVGISKEFDPLTLDNEIFRLNYGFILGGGLKYDLTKFQIGIHADYYINCNKIADWPAVIPNLGGTIADKTFTLNLSLGYKL